MNADMLAESMFPRAAALVAAVDNEDAVGVSTVLVGLSTTQLHALAVVLAAHTDPDRPFTRRQTRTSFDDVIVEVARRFDVTTDRVISPDRAQPSCDARAVICYVGRALGMSSPEIGRRVGRDHSTVLYAQSRVGENARLRRIANDVWAGMGLVTDEQAAIA